MRPKKTPKKDLILTGVALVLGGVLIFPAFHLALTLAGIALWGFAAWRVATWVPDGKGLPLFSENELHDPQAKPRRSARFYPWTVLLLPLFLFLFQRYQLRGSWVAALFFLGLMVGIFYLLETTQKAFDPTPFRTAENKKWVWGFLWVLGAFFLFFKFSQLPCWMDNDCANCIADALYFFHGEATTPFKTVWGDNPALPYMLYGLSFKVFGISFASAALVAALFQLACLPLYHGFCRFFLPSGAAWLSAGLFACSRWYLFFVRTPRETSLLPCFEAAALFFFVRAIETGQKKDHAWFGLSLALLLQTYLPSRAMLVFFLATLGVIGLYQRAFLRKGLSRWGLAFGILTLFLLPLVHWYTLHPELVLDRMRKISILVVLREEGSLAPLWKSISECFWVFNVRGGTDDHYNLMGVPLMDPVAGLCFWVGFAWCLSRCFRFPFLFLIMGFLAGFLGMVLADTPGHPMRAIASAPFVFLFAGLGADLMARALGSLWPRGRKVLYPLVLGGVLGSAVIWNFIVHFDRMPQDKVFLNTNNQYEFLAGKTLAPYPQGWDAYLDFDGFMHTYVYTYKRAELRFFLPDFALPIRKVPESGAVVLLDGLGAVVEDLMRDLYPRATFKRIPFYAGNQALWLWELSPKDIKEGLGKPTPPAGSGIWITPIPEKGEGPGAGWWPALFGINKWVRGWNFKYPRYATSFSLKENRPLKLRVQGHLRIWVNGVEREGVASQWGDKELLLEGLPPNSVLRFEYSPDRDVHLLDLLWKDGEKFVPIPSGAYRCPVPPKTFQKPKDFEPGEAQLLRPDW